MGREIKRVALDFKWPLGEIWDGFKSPDSGEAPCPFCKDSHGYTSGYGRMGLAIHNLSDYNLRKGILPSDGKDYEEADLLILRALREKVNGPGLLPAEEERLPYVYGFRPDRGMTDSKRMIYDLLTHLAKSLDLPLEVFFCKTCKGKGNIVKDHEQNARALAWVATPPPEGEGWQIWETVSEGSPVSPVFATAEELEVFMSTVGTKWDPPVSIEAARAFVRSGWAPSAVILNGVMSTTLDVPLAIERDRASNG